jgi:hypothetical protein
LLQATAGKNMTVSLMEGHGTIGVGGNQQDLVGGQELTVPLGGANGLQASGPPTIAHPIQWPSFDLPVQCQVAKAAGIILPCQPTPVCTFNVAKFVAGSNPANLVVNVTGAPSCAATKMYWTVSGVESVSFGVESVPFNGIKVPLDASYGVCITKPTTYELRMVCGGVTKSVFYTLQYQPITNKGQ